MAESIRSMKLIKSKTLTSRVTVELWRIAPSTYLVQAINLNTQKWSVVTGSSTVAEYVYRFEEESADDWKEQVK